MENNPPRSNFVDRIAPKIYPLTSAKKIFPAKRPLLSNQPLMLMHPLSNTRFLPQSQYIYSISEIISIHFQYIMKTSQYISIYHQYISILINQSTSSIHLQYNSIHLQKLYPLTKTGRLLQYQDSFPLTLWGDISTPAKL